MIKENALLEIGCEEIPARFMPELIADLKKKTEDKLASGRIEHGKIEAFGTPRRLVLYIEGIPSKQPDMSEEIKGPPAEIAFDGEGRPAEAARGFARKNGVKPEQLVVRTENGRNYVFARVVRKGLPAVKLLSKLFPEIAASLYLPVSMRWGSLEAKFIRPVHWILAMYGEKTVKFELFGIRSSNTTRGHRFVKREIPIKKASIVQYKAKLLLGNVIVDQEERKERIRDVVKKAAPMALIEEDLLNEVNYLVETPHPLVCSFNADFLALPKEVLVTSMKKNQKYFPVLNDSGRLSSKFVVITNGCRNKGVREGNERVISARLSDAKFFFDEDREVPLKVRVHDLKRVQFFEGLSDMQAKSERIKKLSGFIAKQLKVGPERTAVIERVAELCKADLLTQMVFEFPELQGVMGREYALASGEDPKAAQGIYEHYLPRHADDSLPRSLEGTVVSLADRIDTIAGCFGLGKVPTGSVDPYGLRRSALGIIRIMIAGRIELLLSELFSFAFKNYAGILKEGGFEKAYPQVLEFIAQRLKGQMLEERLPHDVIDASFANVEDILFAHDMAKVLQAARGEPWFLGVVKTHDRVFRISQGGKRDSVMEHDLQDPEERSLFELYLKVNWECEEKLNSGDYAGALLSLSKLTDPTEAFFEKVLVMHEDERIKTNRLALLRTMNSLFLKVADMRKIVV